MAGRWTSGPATVFDTAAEPVLRLADGFDQYARDGERAVLDQAAGLLDRFETEAQRAGAVAASVKPARYGLAVYLDQIARAHPRIKLSTWSVLAQQKLFEGRDIGQVRIREFRDTAAKNGADFADLETFLTGLLDRMEDRRHGHRRRSGGHWGWWVAGSVLVFVLALASYAVFLEYRFHARITQDFQQQQIEIGLDRPHDGPELVRRLGLLSEAVDRISRAAERAPFRRSVVLPFVDSEAQAQAAYDDAVATHVPRLVADAIETVIATEGDGLILYDTLRAWTVLTGEDDWQPAYVAGWLDDHAGPLGLTGLGDHAAVLTGPATEIVPQDAELMDQARGFAAETSETDRAWLELLRAGETRALTTWQPEMAVPGLSDVVLRRSGRPLDEGMPGLFTQAGWAFARNFGIGVAVQKSRQIGPEITGVALPTRNDTPDLLLDRLHLETIAAWKDWLADLRVRPFVQRDTAILVSGTLARADNPLTRLLEEVWVQVGGTDRQRSHEQQLRLAREFGPMIQYVEQGRMAEIARLFSTLNVALGAADFNQERAAERLMGVQDKARSVVALKGAPRIVVQITEDVLAQSARPEDGLSGNPLTRQWQQLVYPVCRAAVDGRYPFADGPEADMAALAELFGPTGAFTTFFNAGVAQYLDTEASPWRWKPEARFEGLTPESAAFFEQAVVVSEALFDDSGRIGMNMTFAALAERGQTLLAIGGQAVPVRATGAPATLSWPGPEPQRGIEVSFREGPDAARLIHQGAWGLLKLTDGLRLRLRDEGRRVLLDLRTNEGRVFLEVGLGAPVNPVSARAALAGFACPPVL